MTTPTDRAIEALRELVALKDMKDAGWGSQDTETEDAYLARKPAAWSEARAALAAVDAQPAEPVQEPVTLADVLDALNLFNKPRPSECDEPWTEADFIAVTHLPDFINIIAAAWFSPAASAAPAPPTTHRPAADVVAKYRADPEKAALIDAARQMLIDAESLGIKL